MMRLNLVLSLVLILAPARLPAQVSYERLVRADSEPGSWLTYSGNYAAHRFSALSDITSDNVARLKPIWVYQIREPGLIETTPLVVEGIMYATEPPSTVTALDLHSGRPLWRW